MILQQMTAESRPLTIKIMQKSILAILYSQIWGEKAGGSVNKWIQSEKNQEVVIFKACLLNSFEDRLTAMDISERRKKHTQQKRKSYYRTKALHHRDG